MAHRGGNPHFYYINISKNIFTSGQENGSDQSDYLTINPARGYLTNAVVPWQAPDGVLGNPKEAVRLVWPTEEEIRTSSVVLPLPDSDSERELANFL